MTNLLQCLFHLQVIIFTAVKIISIFIVKVAYCKLLWSHIIEKNMLPVFEPRCKKTGLRGFRPSPTQTELYSHRRWLKA